MKKLVFKAGYKDAKGHFVLEYEDDEEVHLVKENVFLPVKIKRLSDNSVIPFYAHESDAGMDLTATSCKYDDAHDNYVYGTGLAFEIPEGYVGLVFPRSSNRRTYAYMTNSVGVVDSGYRGEVYLTFKNRDYCEDKKPYEVGEKIGQIIIMPYPKVQFDIVDKLSESDRGDNGHGSTGK